MCLEVLLTPSPAPAPVPSRALSCHSSGTASSPRQVLAFRRAWRLSSVLCTSVPSHAQCVTLLASVPPGSQPSHPESQGVKGAAGCGPHAEEGGEVRQGRKRVGRWNSQARASRPPPSGSGLPSHPGSPLPFRPALPTGVHCPGLYWPCANGPKKEPLLFRGTDPSPLVRWRSGRPRSHVPNLTPT